MRKRIRKPAPLKVGGLQLLGAGIRWEKIILSDGWRNFNMRVEDARAIHEHLGKIIYWLDRRDEMAKIKAARDIRRQDPTYVERYRRDK